MKDNREIAEDLYREPPREKGRNRGFLSEIEKHSAAALNVTTAAIPGTEKSPLVHTGAYRVRTEPRIYTGMIRWM